jgi:hypothetical protein
MIIGTVAASATHLRIQASPVSPPAGWRAEAVAERAVREPPVVTFLPSATVVTLMPP